MRTAISESDSVTTGPGATGAPALRPAPAHRARHAGGRRPRGARPPAATVRYERAHLATRPRGPHPAQRVERARVGLATIAVTALLSAVAVGGLLAVAQLRSEGGADTGRTTLVHVREGESLSEVAARVDPADPVRATVDKIIELNGLRGAEVAPGRTLLVPTHER
ncbi:LysM peptidoglycan-binding domain-containing protein [Nocardia terpenica]|uniref:LysM peptidoglycan-binding domain-containing protein n=1 Tax=Nocardia terpenica TaxID=455432 RepID=A0A6G9Z7J8_9NOCA|nr:LysM peptidoglycan-binding domain-containing protein [Nocardia terpenica]QIS21327.1 LysM peptidoglycan-binding domain-containing protein [Nocardia terpenica]